MRSQSTNAKPVGNLISLVFPSTSEISLTSSVLFPPESQFLGVCYNIKILVAFFADSKVYSFVHSVIWHCICLARNCFCFEQTSFSLTVFRYSFKLKAAVCFILHVTDIPYVQSYINFFFFQSVLATIRWRFY